MSICSLCCVKLLLELGLKWGGIFGILKKFFKIFFFKKVHYFWVWRLFVGVYCGFGELGVYMSLEFDIVLFVFCFGGFLNHFWV